MSERLLAKYPVTALTAIGATIASLGLAVQGCSAEKMIAPDNTVKNAPGFAVPYCYDTPRRPDGSISQDTQLPDEHATGERIDVHIRSKPGEMTPKPITAPLALRRHLGNAVVRMKVDMPNGAYRIGTGFKVAPDKVLTSAHTLIGAELSSATLTSKDAKKAKPSDACVIYEKKGTFVNPDIAKEATIDVAVLTIPPDSLGSETLTFANSLPVRGDNSTSYRSYQGNRSTQSSYQGIMLGELTDNRASFLTGIDPKYNCEPKPISHCAAQPGSSGSPLVNPQNEVIGISNWSTFMYGPMSKVQLMERHSVIADIPEGKGSGNYPAVAIANTYHILQYAMDAPRA